MVARLSQPWVDALLVLLSYTMLGHVVTALSVTRLLGMMAVAMVVVPLGLLHMEAAVMVRQTVGGPGASATADVAHPLLGISRLRVLERTPCSDGGRLRCCATSF